MYQYCFHVLLFQGTFVSFRIVCTRYLWKDEIPVPEEIHDSTDNHRCLDNRHYSSVRTDDPATYEPRSASHSASQVLQQLQSSVARQRKRLLFPGTTDDVHHAREKTPPERVAVPGLRMFHMKRQWFFVAEVVDKFAFLIYLVTMSFTILMILYIVPVYMRDR